MKKNKPVKSNRKNKKLMVLNDNNKIVHFGFSGMSDFTKHKDPKRQKNYIQRSGGIINKQGKLTKNDKNFIPGQKTPFLLFSKVICDLESKVRNMEVV